MRYLLAAAAAAGLISAGVSAQEIENPQADFENAIEAATANAEPGKPVVIPGSDEITIELEAGHDAELSEAFAEIHAAHPAEAIKIFDTVIFDYDAKYVGRATYCANSLEESAAILLLKMASGKDDEAKVTILGPNWCEALFGKGFALIDLGRNLEAETYLTEAVNKAPLELHYLNELAEWYKSARNWHKSLELFMRAYDLSQDGMTETSPEVTARALRGMAFNQVELGDLKLARKLYKQSLEFDPDSTMVPSELEYIDALEAGKN